MIFYISITVHNLSVFITIGFFLLVKLVYQFAFFFFLHVHFILRKTGLGVSVL